MDTATEGYSGSAIYTHIYMTPCDLDKSLKGEFIHITALC